MPTITPLFEGSNLVHGVITTGQSIFASFKPILILLVGLLGGFFVIFLIITIIKNIILSRANTNEFVDEVIDKQIIAHYKTDIEKIMKQHDLFVYNPEVVAKQIKGVGENYKKLIKELKKK
jgi:hypothetical protein